MGENVSQELRKKLKNERRSRRRAEALLGERSRELTQVQAELDQLKEELPKDQTGELLGGILASLHEPLKALLQAMAELFERLPPDAQDRKDEIRTELGRLVSVLHSIQARQEAARIVN